MSEVGFINTFPSLWLVFFSLNPVFYKTKKLNFSEVQFINFCGLCFLCHILRHFGTQGHVGFLSPGTWTFCGSHLEREHGVFWVNSDEEQACL